jgi:hypothetical protein
VKRARKITFGGNGHCIAIGAAICHGTRAHGETFAIPKELAPYVLTTSVTRCAAANSDTQAVLQDPRKQKTSTEGNHIPTMTTRFDEPSYILKQLGRLATMHSGSKAVQQAQEPNSILEFKALDAGHANKDRSQDYHSLVSLRPRAMVHIPDQSIDSLPEQVEPGVFKLHDAESSISDVDWFGKNSNRKVSKRDVEEWRQIAAEGKEPQASSNVLEGINLDSVLMRIVDMQQIMNNHEMRKGKVFEVPISE